MANQKATDSIICLDAKDGTEIWRYSYECPEGQGGLQAAPVIDGKYVYTLSRNGKQKWSRNLSKDLQVM